MFCLLITCSLLQTPGVSADPFGCAANKAGCQISTADEDGNQHPRSKVKSDFCPLRPSTSHKDFKEVSGKMMSHFGKKLILIYCHFVHGGKIAKTCNRPQT